MGASEHLEKILGGWQDLEDQVRRAIPRGTTGLPPAAGSVHAPAPVSVAALSLHVEMQAARREVVAAIASIVSRPPPVDPGAQISWVMSYLAAPEIASAIGGLTEIAAPVYDRAARLVGIAPVTSRIAAASLERIAEIARGGGACTVARADLAAIMQVSERTISRRLAAVPRAAQVDKVTGLASVVVDRAAAVALGIAGYAIKVERVEKVGG